MITSLVVCLTLALVFTVAKLVKVTRQEERHRTTLATISLEYSKAKRDAHKFKNMYGDLLMRYSTEIGFKDESKNIQAQ